MKVGVQFGFGNVTPVSDQDVDRPALDKSSCLMVTFAPGMVARICSTAASHLLCELFGSMAGVLERNISGAFARDFKARAMAKIGALAQLVARHLRGCRRSSPRSLPRAR